MWINHLSIIHSRKIPGSSCHPPSPSPKKKADLLVCDGEGEQVDVEHQFTDGMFHRDLYDKTGEIMWKTGVSVCLALPFFRCGYIQDVHDTYLHTLILPKSSNMEPLFCLHMFIPENNVDTPHALLNPIKQADWKNSMPGKKGNGRVYTELVSPTWGRNMVFNVSNRREASLQNLQSHWWAKV